MGYVPTVEKTRAIKRRLSQFFVAKNVRVYAGRGTASAWIHIDITVPSTAASTVERHREYSDLIRRVARKALEDIGTDFAKYTPDDGIEEPRDCVLIRVRKERVV